MFSARISLKDVCGKLVFGDFDYDYLSIKLENDRFYDVLKLSIISNYFGKENVLTISYENYPDLITLIYLLRSGYV